MDISIHAPTWGATYTIKHVCGHEEISIHAPTWGATCSLCELAPSCVFQSTHPRGVRRALFLVSSCFILFQSTHPRGVRRSRRARSTSWQDFNPRTHVGCDLTNFGSRHADFLFQSTHPRGVRPPRQTCSGNLQGFQSTHPRGVRHGRVAPFGRDTDFNPRTHVGCDLVRMGKTAGSSNFNPRTHVGCDSSASSFEYIPRSISIHAPTWGATFSKDGQDGRIFEFQSTHPRGVRQAIKDCCCQTQQFQSTHPRGVRRMMFAQRMWGNGEFQSTHPRGVRPARSRRA